MNVKKRNIAICVAASLLLAGGSAAQTWQSSKVQLHQDGSLSYAVDSAGSSIPDFSYAGYRNGEVAIPDVPVVRTIGPVAGDNTAHIQGALNEVGLLVPDGAGFRGTLLLQAGVYRVSGTLYVNASGVVLRGVGDGPDSTSNTIILAVGDTPHQRPVIVAGGGSETKWSDQVAGTRTDIVSDTVAVGGKSFRVANPVPYSVGDNVILYHPCTDAWLRAIDYGGVATDSAWKVGEQPILFNRRIAAISGDLITVDAPLFTTFVRSLSQAYLYRTSRTGVKVNIGLERLRVEIEAAGTTTDANGDENHAWDAIRLVQIEDAWVRHCTMLHFGQAGVETATATRVTIDSCSALEPVGIITGERRYNFNMYTASQLILVSNCQTSYGRHDYVSNGSSWVSGCVFVDCHSEHTYASSEGHRRWSTGLLYDNVTYRNPMFTGAVLGLYNRGDYGTGHGWAAAHSVAWNCDAGTSRIIVQKPPTAQNYAIGSKAGVISGRPPVAPFDQPEGFIEGVNRADLEPRSLYHAQLSARLTPLEVKEPSPGRPEGIRLEQNYPNPCNPLTRIELRIKNSEFLILKVFDMLGREIATLLNETRPAGTHQVDFDGSALASGVYLYRLQAGTFVQTRKLLLLQ